MKHLKKVFIDFDGTLIDPRKRLYYLFVELAQCEDITFEQYWKIKRKGVLQYNFLRDVLHKKDNEIEIFRQQWLERIEEKKYLRLDSKLVYSDELLSMLYMKSELYLWTNRQSKENLCWQLENFGWRNYFTDILVTEHCTTKEQLLKSTLVKGECGIVIGDTKEDYLAAKALNLECYIITDEKQYSQTDKGEMTNNLVESLQDLLKRNGIMAND